MKILNLTLSSFRNFSKISFAFKESNIIVGQNASGKSTILEAIHLIATTKSDRSGFDKEMITLGKEVARVEAAVTKGDDLVKLEMRIAQSEHFNNLARKTVKINGVAKALNNFQGTFNTVMFSPLDLQIVTDGPSIRRKYIDSILCQISREYRLSHSNLLKAIKQRNKLLERLNKEGRGWDEIDFWDDVVSKESTTVHDYRKKFFDEIMEPLKTYGRSLQKGKATLSIQYKQSLATKERLREYREREIAAKNTLIGPNRDDFTLYLGEVDLESFGSRGQQRTAVLALKLCEIDYIEDKVLERPVLLLDDIFSELDEEHKSKVLDIIDLQQTIITTTDRGFLDKTFGESNLINLSKI